MSNLSQDFLHFIYLSIIPQAWSVTPHTVPTECLLLSEAEGGKELEKACSRPDGIVTVVREARHVEIKGKQDSRSLCNLPQMGGVIIIMGYREDMRAVEPASS